MTFEIGQRVRVLHGARSNVDYGDDDYFEDVAGDKSGLITGGPDFDGDYDVEDDDENYWAFAPEFLEPLEETPAPTPEVKVGDKIRVTREFVVGRNDGWRLIVDDLDRTPIVVEGAKVEILERAQVAPKVGDLVDPQAGYASGTVAVLDTDSSSVVVKIEGDRWAGSVIGNGLIGDLLPDRWKIIYIPEEGK